MRQILLYISFPLFVFACSDNGNSVGDNEIAGDLSGTLAFQSNRTGNFEIFVNSGSNTAISNVSLDPLDDTNPSLSLNADKLIFVSKRDASPHVHLYQNNELIQITAGDAEFTTPQISRVGNKIVFVRDYNVYIMNSTGTGITQLTFTGGDTFNYSPSFSFDDSKIIFTRNIDGGNSDIMMMNGLGGSVQNLTNGIGDNLQPAFSPDGTQIVFSRNNHICILTISTKAVKDLMPSDSLRFNGYPVYSPNGKTIAFVSNRTGDMDIFTMDTNGKNLRNITKNDAIDTFPYWSE